MEVLIETQNVDIPANGASSLRQRVAKVMRNLSANVIRLHLSLKDVNGQKGGRDKVCTVRATLAEGGEVVVVGSSWEKEG